MSGGTTEGSISCTNRGKEAPPWDRYTMLPPPPKMDVCPGRISEQRNPNKDDMRHRPQVLEASTLTSLTRDISMMLKLTKHNNHITHLGIRKDGGSIDRDLQLHCNYHIAKCHHTNNCFMLRRDMGC